MEGLDTGLGGLNLVQLFILFTGLFTGLLSAVPAQAMNLPNPPSTEGNLLGSIGLVSVLESLSLTGAETDGHEVQYTLPDGTRVGGLLYVDPSKGNRPLIIADFGLMSSTNSALAAQVIEKVVLTGMLDANFLVVDDISGAEFFVTNRSLSLGGYDAGRVLNELADAVAAEHVPFSSITLMGESLGGLAVLEALVEDQRRGTHHFQSAITFSGVTDELQATGTVMSAFGRSLDGVSGPALPSEGLLFLTSALTSFDAFIAASPVGGGLPEPSILSAGDTFYDQFSARLAALTAEAPADWNPVVSASKVEWYLATSATLLNNLDASTAPAIVVHAQNDPVVAYSQFQNFAQAEAGNPHVFTLATSEGSHCGFIGVYGASWVAGLINRAIGL